MNPLIASTYTYLWRETLDAALGAIAAAGFDRVELLAAAPHVDVSPSLRGAEEVVRRCEQLGLRVHSVVPSGLDVNLASPDPSARDWSVEHFIWAGRFAAAVGARWLVTHPGRRHPLRPPPYESCVAWAIDGVERIVEELQSVGVGILFENTPTGVLDRGAECADLARRVGVGLCYDVANGHAVESLGEGIVAVADHLELVHLSDSTKAAWAHDPIGAGEIRFDEVCRRLSEVGYAGDAVVETLHDDGDGRLASGGFAADVEALRAAGWGQGASVSSAAT